MTGKTCTTRLATGGVCGAPAIAVFAPKFVGRGEVFYECAVHYTGPPMREPEPERLVVGARVGVIHVGVHKTGRVVKVTPTKVHVEVATYGGKATKVIVRPKTEVTT